MIRLSILILSLICAGCSTVNSGLDGQYDGPNGATLKLSQTQYEFCDRICSRGLVEVRASGARAGRVTFFGIPIMGYFRRVQRGSQNVGLRTWADGVETSYHVGVFGGLSIDIDRDDGIYFKRRR